MIRHRVTVLVVGVVVVAALALILLRPVAPVLPTEPRPWAVADLPKHLYRSPGTVSRVELSFPLPLVPTADPLVWRYHPGHPPSVVPHTYEVHFDTPPVFPTAPPFTVTATVSHIEFDLVRRLSGVPGFVVLRHAALRASP